MTDQTGREAVFQGGTAAHKTDAETAPRGARIHARLLERKWLILAAGLVFLALAGLAGLDWRAALAGFVVLALAAMVAPLEGRIRLVADLGVTDAAPDRQVARVQDILEAIPDPAILLSPGGIILHFNRKAGEHYGSLRRGAHISATIRNPEVLEAATKAGEGAGPVTVTYSERVPVARRIEASLAPLPPAPQSDKMPPAVMMCLRDLTEQEHIDRMRADFIANASHELRTPLASLVGFIETLQGPAREDGAAREKFLDVMGQQAGRMSRLIDDLLSLSRVEMNAHLPPSTLVDVAETVRYVADTLDPIATEVGVDLVLDIPEGARPVQGDRDELVQVFQNLIQNAIKYSAGGDQVRVSLAREHSASEEGGRIAVSVADTGPGIAPEHLPRLTERFYRIDVNSSRKKGGTGLGLAIVKHVVTRHRGELKIASEPGKGSTFTVVLSESGASRSAAASPKPSMGVQ